MGKVLAVSNRSAFCTRRASTTAHDVVGWDSLSHIRLTLNVERQFNVEFSAAEVRASVRFSAKHVKSLPNMSAIDKLKLLIMRHFSTMRRLSIRPPITCAQ
jgi:acyl carrier protein